MGCVEGPQLGRAAVARDLWRGESAAAADRGPEKAAAVCWAQRRGAAQLERITVYYLLCAWHCAEYSTKI